MDAFWIAPVVALLAGLIALVVAGRSTRRAAASLVADTPALTAVGDELAGLHTDLATLRARVDARRAASGPASNDR